MEESFARSSESSAALDPRWVPDRVPSAVNGTRSLNNATVTAFLRCWQVTCETANGNTDKVMQNQHRASIATESTLVPKIMLKLVCMCLKCIHRHSAGCQCGLTALFRLQHVIGVQLHGLYEATR